MLLGCGCLLAMLIGLAPRLALIIMAIAGERINIAFDTVIFPILGWIFAPYTTIFYVLVYHPVTGVTGWDWVWVGLGVLLDIMKWSQIVRNREGIPGQASKQPAAQTAAVSATDVEERSAPQPAEQEAPTNEAVGEEMPAEETAGDSVQSELDGLADLRDKGIITEEEYQAKKGQLEG